MISHDNVTWTTRDLLDSIPFLNHTERIVSYLPLSHIAAQIIDVHAPMYIGCSVYFAQPDALKGSLTTTLKDVRPTFFFGVPRVWEKIHEKMAQLGREVTGVKKMLSTWTKSHRAQFGNGGGAPLFFCCAHGIVLSKIKAALGLDQARVCFTGAAPITLETLEYFASLDISIYEVFSQSECTGPHTLSMPGQWKIGSCGRSMLGTEGKICPGNNELCYRGRHIFMGYMYNPAGTAETIDNRGFLHSGDVAEFDSNTNPQITG